MTRPPIGAYIRLSDGYVAEVIKHTERGFEYKGLPRSFIPRWGMGFTGEGEIFTDLPEYEGFEGFGVITKEEYLTAKAKEDILFVQASQEVPPPPTTGAILGEKEYQSHQNRLYAAVGEIICHRTLCELCQNHKNYAIDRLFAGKGKPEVFLQALIDYDGMICHAAEWMIDTARKALEDKS